MLKRDWLIFLFSEIWLAPIHYRSFDEASPRVKRSRVSSCAPFPASFPPIVASLSPRRPRAQTSSFDETETRGKYTHLKVSSASVSTYYPALILFGYSGTWPSYLTDLLSLRLVGTVGARINVRSSHSQPRPTVTWIWTLRFSQLQPSAFNNRANPLSGFIKNPTLQCLVTWLGRVEFNSFNSLTIKGDNYHMFPIDTWTSVPGWHWFEQMMAKGERLRIPEAQNYARRKGCVRKWIRITIGLFADTAVSVWCVWWALVGGITEFGQ